jgi:uncharacterized membrane protein YkoI
MRTIVLTTIAGACLLAGLPDRAGARPPGPDLLLLLPQAARRTVLAEAAKETVASVTRTNGAEGEVLYDVQTARDGRSRDLTVAPDGKLLDIQVFLGELTMTVEKSITNLTQGAELGDITKDTSDPYGDTFDVEMTRGGTNRTFSVDESGVLLEIQVFLPEIPPSVLKTIQAKVGRASLGDITRAIDEGEVTYKVEMTNAGRARDFTVSTNGELLDEQVFLDEIPAAVQKAVQAQAKRGHLGEINKSTEDGEIYYEVNLRIGPNAHAVTFDAAGVFQSEEANVAWAELPPLVKRALKPQQGAAVVADITRETDGTNVTYEIILSDEGVHRTLVFKPDGAIVRP